MHRLDLPGLKLLWHLVSPENNRNVSNCRIFSHEYELFTEALLPLGSTLPSVLVFRLILGFPGHQNFPADDQMCFQWRLFFIIAVLEEPCVFNTNKITRFDFESSTAWNFHLDSSRPMSNPVSESFIWNWDPRFHLATKKNKHHAVQSSLCVCSYICETYLGSLYIFPNKDEELDIKIKMRCFLTFCPGRPTCPFSPLSPGIPCVATTHIPFNSHHFNSCPWVRYIINWFRLMLWRTVGPTGPEGPGSPVSPEEPCKNACFFL